jgi:hypothetical protein
MSAMISSLFVLVLPTNWEGLREALVSEYWLMRPSLSHARRYTPVKFSGLASRAYTLPGALASPARAGAKAVVPRLSYLPPPGERGGWKGLEAPDPPAPRDCVEITNSPLAKGMARKGLGEAKRRDVLECW